MANPAIEQNRRHTIASPSGQRCTRCDRWTRRSQKSVRNDWDEYSRRWDAEFGAAYRNLGDEWANDNTSDRKRDALFFTAYAERWINLDSEVLEVGLPGGRWTVRLAPKVKRLTVLDVSEEMLNRTRARVESLGLSNIDYVVGNGADFEPIPDASIDFFFSWVVLFTPTCRPQCSYMRVSDSGE